MLCCIQPNKQLRLLTFQLLAIRLIKKLECKIIAGKRRILRMPCFWTPSEVMVDLVTCQIAITGNFFYVCNNVLIFSFWTCLNVFSRWSNRVLKHAGLNKRHETSHNWADTVFTCQRGYDKGPWGWTMTDWDWSLKCPVSGGWGRGDGGRNAPVSQWSYQSPCVKIIFPAIVCSQWHESDVIYLSRASVTVQLCSSDCLSANTHTSHRRCIIKEGEEGKGESNIN